MSNLFLKEIIKDNNYQISDKTYALKQHPHERKSTLIYDERGIYYVEKKPIKLLREACIIYGSTLEGRRAAIVEQFDYSFKTPIPISPVKYIFAYPTSSIDSPDCEWYFANNIIKITNYNYGSEITFRNGTTITSSFPAHLMKKQLERTALCMIILALHKKIDYQRFLSQIFELQ